MTPGDTAWPIIGYTLLIPGQTTAFVHFSEPIVTLAGATPAASDFDAGGSGIAAVTGSGPGIAEATWTTTALGAATLAAGATDFSFDGTLRDMGAAPLWDTAYDNQIIGEPNPTYPPSSGYTADPNGYALAAGKTQADRIVVNPFELDHDGSYTTGHRVTDALISVPPALATDTAYFVWPIYAKDQVSLSLDDAAIEALTATESHLMGPGLIRAFDGTQWLRDQDLKIQARRSAASGAGAVTLHYDTSPDSDFYSAYGLWLPAHDEWVTSDPYYSGLDGFPDDALHGGGTVPLSTAESSTGSALWNATVDSDNARMASGRSFEFFYTLDGSPSDLYVVRLDMAAGGTIPTNWYRLLRPFAFDIHDLALQRGSVTILNNVIDPTQGETVRLAYTLTAAGPTTITVFTLDGDVVRRLYMGNQAAGSYSVSWDGTNLAGLPVARGVYFIRVVAPGVDEIRKVMIIRR